MSVIETRFATAQDRGALLSFIHDHWSATHVFCNAPDVFDWQYLQPDGRFNMVLAQQGDTVLGVLGFIPMGRFDAALGDGDVLLALWKVRDDIAPPGLGLRMLKLIQSQLKPRMIGAIGTSEMVGPLYRALGYTLDHLHHAAIFAEGGAARIASGVPDHAFAAGSINTGDCRLIAPTLADHDAVEMISASNTPHKSLAYVQERYLNHPFYAYHTALVWQNTKPRALVVWRRVECNGSHILRIVDIIGDTDWLAHGQALFRPILAQSGAEYIDLMQLGTNDGVLQTGGWISPDWVDGLILPNYFAPFVAQNITITLAYRQFTPGARPVRLYRADSDQDRPNMAPVIAERRT